MLRHVSRAFGAMFLVVATVFAASAQGVVESSATKLQEWFDYPDALFNPASEDYDETALAALKANLESVSERTAADDAVITLIDVVSAPVCCGEDGARDRALDYWNTHSIREDTNDLALQVRGILRAHWRMMSGRTDLAGMMGEEAPSDYEQMLFAPVGDLAPGKLPESACLASEQVAFSCKGTGSSRTYSLCVAADVAGRPAQFRSIEEGADAENIYPDTPQPIADAFFQAIWNGDEKFGFNNNLDVQFIGPDTADSQDNASGFILKGGWDPHPWFSCKTTTNDLSIAMEGVPFQGE